MKLPFNHALRILLSTNALILLAAAMLGPIYAIFVERIGGDLMDASLAGGIFALVAGIVTLISGKYTDRIKEQEIVVIVGYLIIGCGFMVYSVVNSIAGLFLVQAIIGIGEAIYSPAFDAVYSKHLSVSKSGAQWGAWESMNYFTSSAGAILGGIIVTVFGFNALFFLMTALCFLSAFYIYRLPRRVL
jgi:predicted MFS family arabinose efflux permease